MDAFNLTPAQWRALKNLINAASAWPNDDFEGRSGRQELTTAYTVARARKTKKAIDAACKAFGAMRDYDDMPEGETR